LIREEICGSQLADINEAKNIWLFFYVLGNFGFSDITHRFEPMTKFVTEAGENTVRQHEV